MADKDLHARLVIHDLDKLNYREARRLVVWLLKIAHEVENPDPAGYAPKVTFRLFK